MAAAALVRHDTDVAARLDELNGRAPYQVRHEEWVEFGQYLGGFWTFSLAAEAAGVTEQQLCTAILSWFGKAGTSVVCQGIAKAVFGS